MSQQNCVRVGLVGAGHISEFHARAIQRIAVARIVGITDVITSRAKDLADKFKVPATFPTIEDMIDEGVDVIHVLTPPSSHAHIAVTALENGCDVLVEKPLAMNAEEVDRIAAVAASVEKRVCVNHSLLYDRFVAKALGIVRSGAIGTPLTFDYFRSSEYPPYRGGPLPLHYKEGGYPFLDQGVHAFYLAEAFLGKIEDVRAYYDTYGRDPLLYDEWRVGARCERGTANIQLSWNVRPLQNWFVVQGTEGVIRANLFAMWVTVGRSLRLPKAAARAVGAICEGLSIVTQIPANIARFACKRIVQYDGLHSLIEAFYSSYLTSSPTPVSAEQARSTVYWTDRVAREANASKVQLHARFEPKGRSKVLVTGATGLIGRHLVRRLLQHDIPVRLLVRRQPLPELIDDPRVEVFLGDLGDPAAVDSAVAGMEIVYHVGATMKGTAHDHERGTVSGTRNIVESVIRHDVQRLLYISSLSCLHANNSGQCGPVTEDWPVEPHPELRGSYTQAKTEAEKIVLDAVRNRQLRVALLRPGRVFGPGAPFLTPDVAQRFKNLIAILGDGTRNLPLVYVDDLVDAIVLTAEKSRFDGAIFHVVDPTQVSQNQLVRFAQSEEHNFKVIHLPVTMLYGLALALEGFCRVIRRPSPISIYRLKSALAPLEFDCTLAKREIGWQPRIGIWSGLQEVLAAEQASFRAFVPSTQPRTAG